MNIFYSYSDNPAPFRNYKLFGGVPGGRKLKMKIEKFGSGVMPQYYVKGYGANDPNFITPIFTLGDDFSGGVTDGTVIVVPTNVKNLQIFNAASTASNGVVGANMLVQFTDDISEFMEIEK